MAICARVVGFLGVRSEFDDLFPIAARGLGLAEIDISRGEIVLHKNILGVGLLGAQHKLARLPPLVWWYRERYRFARRFSGRRSTQDHVIWHI